MTQESASESLISTLKGFQLDYKDALSIVDKINSVANSEPINTQELGEALKRSASAFNASNTDLDKAIALITASNSVLQDASSVGTLWNTTASRIRGASSELESMNEEVDEYVTSSSKLRDLVKGYTGFDILKEDGKTYKDLYDIMVGIGEQWKNLSDLDRAALSEALGGKRNAKGLLAVFDNLDILKKSYETARTSEGSAMEELGNYAQSVEYSIGRAKASLEELANDFLSSSFLKGLIELGNSALRIIDSVVDKAGSLLSIFTAISGLSVIKGLLGADSFASSLLKSFTEYYTGDRANKTMLGNIKQLMKYAQKQSADALAEVSTQALSEATKDITFNWGDEVVEGAVSAGAGAGSGFISGLTSALSGFTPFIALGAVVAGAKFVENAYNKHIDNIAKKAKEASKKWQEDYSVNQGYISDYSQAYDAFANAVSDEEAITYKGKLLELQNQIIDTYGTQAASIDLINGKLETETAKIENLLAIQASTDITQDEQKSQKYAFDQMQLKREYTEVGDIINGITDEASRDAVEAARRAGLTVLEDYSFTDPNNPSERDIIYTLKVEGDAHDSDQIMKNWVNELTGLTEKYANDEGLTTWFNDALTKTNETLKENQGLIDKFGDGADSYLDVLYYLKGGGEIERKIANAVKNLNDAYAEGDPKKVSAMRQALADSEEEFESFIANDKALSGIDFSSKLERYEKDLKSSTGALFDLNQVMGSLSENSEKTVQAFDQARDAYNEDAKSKDVSGEATEALTEKQNSMMEQLLSDTTKLTSDNGYLDAADDILLYQSRIKNLGVDLVDVKAAFDSLAKKTSWTRAKDLTPLEKAVKGFADSIGLVISESPESQAQIASILDLFEKYDVAKNGLQENEETQLGIDLDSLVAKYTTALSKIDNVNAALINSFSAKGLTYQWDEESKKFTGDVANIINAYEHLEGFNESALFNRTANGIKINTEELRKLESQQQKITKQGFYKEQEKALKKLNEAKLKAAEEGRDINTDTNVEQARKAVEQIQYMIAAYDGATSAYQNWLEVAQQGEEGDMYDNIRDTAIKRGDELMKEGLIGTEEFRAIAELMSGQDLTEATAKEVKEAYKGINETIEGSSHTVRSFFEEGRQGAKNFANTLVELGKATKSEDGVYSFSNINTEDLAKEMNTSVDIVESALHKLKDYGFNIQWFNPEQLAQIDLCNEKIQNLSSRIEEVNKNAEHPVAYSIDVENLNDIESIDSEIINLQHILSESQTLQLNSDQYKAYSALLDELINKRNVLAGYDPSQGITSSSIQAGDAAFEDAIARFQAAADKGVTINIEGDEELQRDAQILAKLPPELKTKYGFEADADAQEILEVLQGKVKPVDQKLEAPAGTVSTDDVVQTEQTTNATVNVEANTEEAEKSVEDFTEDVESEPVTKKVKTEYTSEEKSEMAEDTSTESIRQEMISIHSEYDSSGSDQAKQAISEIPNEKDVEINAEATGVDEASAEIDDAAQSRQADIEVSATGDTTGVSDQEVTVTVNFVKGDQQPPEPQTADVNYKRKGQEEPLPKTSHVYYNWAGQSDPHDATAQLHYEGIKTTLPTIIQTVQLHYTGGAGLPVSGGHFAGTAQVGRSALSSFYGAAHASGNWGTRRTEKALLAELGPEILVLKNATLYSDVH